jgi:hypothetical protein
MIIKRLFCVKDFNRGRIYSLHPRVAALVLISPSSFAMNFCAAQIGVHEPEYRSRCINLGEALRLYKDEHVAKNCTPSYLPEFIRVEVAKRE